MLSRICGLKGSLAGFVLAVSACVVGSARAGDVEQWGVFETSLDGPRDGNPYLEVQFSATFSRE